MFSHILRAYRGRIHSRRGSKCESERHTHIHKKYFKLKKIQFKIDKQLRTAAAGGKGSVRMRWGSVGSGSVSGGIWDETHATTLDMK